MHIRRASMEDLPGIVSLLEQVLEVHHHGRPDLFKANTRKYTDEQLVAIIGDDTRPVFVAKANNAAPGQILGYAFCIHQQHVDDNVLTDVRTLYIDDLCVDEQARGMHVGTRLYEYVLDYARTKGCYNVTLNVWSCNEPAQAFYEHLGLKPQKIGMETIL
ncbi:MAG: GNAT family N-acetyltransferase [Atopobiaceae bacterium]|nr:GNAT family N-acetyltransferase [Atopobiaceae bacterium]